MNEHDAGGPTEDRGQDDSGVLETQNPSHRRRSHLLVVAVLAIAASLVAACSFFLANDNATQCTKNSDCANIPQSVCGPDNTCVRPANYCTSASQCPKAATGMVATCSNFACGTTSAMTCSQASDCVKYFDGGPSFCNSNGVCEQLSSETCQSDLTSSNGKNQDCTDTTRPYCLPGTSGSTGECVACLTMDSQCPATNSSGVPLQCVANDCVPLKTTKCRVPSGQTSVTNSSDCAKATSSAGAPLPDCLATPGDSEDVNGICIGCLHNTECIAQASKDGGAGAAVCIDNACVSLLSPDCQDIVGTPTDYSQDNVLIFGILSLTAGSPNNATGQYMVNATAITRNQFLSVFSGLPGATGAPARPFIFVACNESLDVAPSVTAAQHLVNDLHVPAVVGGHQSANTYYESTQVFAPAKPPVVNITGANTGAVTSLDNGVSFRNSATDLDFMPLYQLAVTNIEKTLETNHTIPTNGLKVVTFYRGDVTGQYLYPLIGAQLMFDGTTANANAALTTPLYAAYDYGFDMGQTPTQQAAATMTAISSTIAFAPNIIILVGGGETFSDAVNIEMGWGSGPRPNYIFYPSAASAAWNTWMGGVAQNPTLQARILGANAQEPQAGDMVGAQVKTELINEYNMLIPPIDGGASAPDGGGLYPLPGAAISSPGEVAYDDSHLILLGAVAAQVANATAGNPNAPLTGTAIAKAIQAFGTGTLEYAITGLAPSGDIADALGGAVKSIQGGSTINYHGISGAIKFDSNQQWYANSFLFCIGPANTIVPTGIFYNPTTMVLTPTCGGPCSAACPGGPVAAPDGG